MKKLIKSKKNGIIGVPRILRFSLDVSSFARLIKQVHYSNLLICNTMFNLIDMNNRVILGSSSPRRAELLKANNIDFEIVASEYVEVIEQDLLPQNIVLKLALGKGLEVSDRYPEEVVVSADTIVVFKNHKLGKPDNYLELKQWLNSFSGNVVDIWTATVVIKNSQVFAQADKAQVRFKNLSNTIIEQYLSDPEADWMDKAGGFAVQGKASDMVEYDRKSYNIILGLNTEFVLRHTHLK